jgi:hypothetical protein
VGGRQPFPEVLVVGGAVGVVAAEKVLPLAIRDARTLRRAEAQFDAAVRGGRALGLAEDFDDLPDGAEAFVLRRLQVRGDVLRLRESKLLTMYPAASTCLSDTPLTIDERDSLGAIPTSRRARSAVNISASLHAAAA